MDDSFDSWKCWTRQHVKGCRRTALELFQDEEVKYTVLDHEGFLEQEFGFLSEDSEDNSGVQNKKPKKTRKQEDEPEPIEIVWMKGDFNPGEMDYFKFIFSDDFYIFLVDATNQNAEEILAKTENKPVGLANWRATVVDEMKVFLGLLFLMGIIRAGQVTDYWLDHYLFGFPFHCFMSQERFLAILRCLRFTTCESSDDPLFEIRPLIKYFNKTMNTLYNHMGELFECERDRYGLKLCIIATNHGIIQKLNVFEKTIDENDGGRNKEIQSRGDNLFSHNDTRSRKKMGIHILHIMLGNAYHLYNRFSKVKTQLYDYQLDVTEYLLPRPRELPEPVDMQIHLPEPLPKSDSGKTRRKRCKYCKMHQNLRNDSIYGCRLCTGFPGFCLTPCFRLYHKYI